MSTASSPYERALGARMAQLHPTLQRYFRAIPDGSVGIGEGVFTVAGTRNPVIRPLMRLFERPGVAFCGWEREVPFRIENRTIGGRAVATRVFALPGREWTMTDAVSTTPGGALVDTLGRGGMVAARFRIDIDGGALVLTSDRVGIRVGRLRLRLPQAMAPRIRLVERHAGARQQVEVTIDLPIVGRIYEYAGSFTYAIRPI